MSNNVTLKDIRRARRRIAPVAKATPVIESKNLSALFSARVYLKPECFQATGSFKIRGACSFITSLNEDERRKGLVTCSSGNHGAGLAAAATALGGIPVTVFVPQGAETTKLKRIEASGARIIMEGGDFLDTYGRARRYAETHSLRYAHSHDDPAVIAGQGTIGLEIMEECPDAEVIVVPVGGGGLLSGIATAVKSLKKDVRIYGVEAAAAPGAYLSFRDGYCHETVDIKPSLADGLLGTLTPRTWSIIAGLAEGVEIVEEEDIARAMKTLFEAEQIVTEGSGAVGLAAVQAGLLDIRNRRVVFVITGRNIHSEKFLASLRSVT
ncbi:MAG: pyridoxal-phosphate dependent enzyme [Spirochaetales bacterium]|nr:pyridoxal-phosphate dependent enzyme [Spirochaetales bacterium]